MEEERSGEEKRNVLGEGRKFDGEKLRMDLVSELALAEVSRVFDMGSAKYGDRNWELGYSWSRSKAAADRHRIKWWYGQDKDPESGIYELAHVIANYMFLLHFQILKTGTDDRPKLPPKDLERLVKLLS